MEGSVQAPVQALAPVGQHELLQRAVQEEGAAPVDAQCCQVAVHREGGSVLRCCGRERDAMKTTASEWVCTLLFLNMSNKNIFGIARILPIVLSVLKNWHGRRKEHQQGRACDAFAATSHLRVPPDRWRAVFYGIKLFTRNVLLAAEPWSSYFVAFSSF